MAVIVKRIPFREKKLNKRTVIFMLSGLGFSLVILTYLLLCQLPCGDIDNTFEYERLKRSNILIKPSKLEKYTLVILIISGPDNLYQRDIIRETWLKEIDETVVLFRFVIGTAALSQEKSREIIREDNKHKDMVLLDNVKDSYQDLTFKVLQTFVWLSKNVDYKYVLKVDDDSYVLVSGILAELHFKPKERLYWGFFDGRANVKTSGKWKETNWILCDKYLPYARGGGYVLSFDLINFIARNNDLLQLYLSEDVSVGTWLAPLKVYRHHDQNFDTEFMSRGCLNSYLIMHKQSVPSIRALHVNLETTGVLCRTEKVLRGSYEYNWNYPPSQCCNRTNTRQHIAPTR